jgi:hypothetical protein
MRRCHSCLGFDGQLLGCEVAALFGGLLNVCWLRYLQCSVRLLVCLEACTGLGLRCGILRCAVSWAVVAESRHRSGGVVLAEMQPGSDCSATDTFSCRSVRE